MSISEVNSTLRATAPYQAIGLIESLWPDGTTSVGTCAVIGNNDIVTAGHCAYDPDAGGFAASFKFYFGADFNSITERFESTGIELSSDFQTVIKVWPGAYADRYNDSFGAAESQWDVAVLGVSVAIGAQTGVIGTNFGYDGGNLTAMEVGYPMGSIGMMAGAVAVTRQALTGTYVSTAASIGPGSSGGPLLIGDTIIGIKSAGDTGGGVWADIGFVASDLTHALLNNNSIATGAGSSAADVLLGSAGANTLSALAGNDTLIGGADNDVLDGGDGTDWAIYTGTRSDYTLVTTNDQISITDNLSTDGSDLLTHIERVKFSDQTIALGTDTVACQAYRIYQAAFDRAPDAPGLGYWMAKMTSGMDIVEVAARFIDSQEFRSLYGSDADNTAFVTLLYNNVLNRAPDTEGYAWWVDQLTNNAEKTWQKVLSDFSESDENISNVADLIGSGMVYVAYGS